MFKEFKEFALKGNVLDLAIAVVVAGAFGKIVSSLVNDLIMPLVSMLSGGINLSHLNILIREAQGSTPAVTLNYGSFIQTSLDFIIIAFSLFLIIHFASKFQAKKEVEAVPEAVSEEVLLLQEIRDSLKNT